ncbi:adenylyl-sulfate kinase [Paenibacillus sp. 598K]|nr:adenylyl-sulfate kinase [Paenibacillus sp. 598K]
MKEQRLASNGSEQRGGIVWLTGLSGAGKTTLAEATRELLVHSGTACVVLDGDRLRAGLNRDLGFSAADREENMRRTAEAAALFLEQGFVVLVATISPSAAARAAIRDRFREAAFAEVYVKCPLAVCEDRDPKGLYGRARRGEIRQFTGIDAPYEPPDRPELILDTERISVEDNARALAHSVRSMLAD